jgi:hypothetical protein
MKITIKQPCALVFDCKIDTPLFIKMNSGVEYHRRKENGRVVVNFPLVGEYFSNYKPIETIDIHNYYNPSYSFDTQHVRIKQGNQIVPVAYIDLQENCIYVCRGFNKLNYQFQQAILEHEKAHTVTLDEMEADNIALTNYLKRGFNQSQMIFCLKTHAPKCSDRYQNYLTKLQNEQ